MIASLKSLRPVQCHSVQCRQNGNSFRLFYTDLLSDPCPYCGERGNLHALEVIHLIQEDPTGPIPASEHGANQKARYQFLCESSRKGYDPEKGGPKHPKHFTLSPKSATCVPCLLAYGKKLVGQELK